MTDKHHVETEWKEGMVFHADIDGHIVPMDASIEGGGQDSASGPKKLLLAALGGCTGMDVVSLLKKMRVDIKKCSIEVQGHVAEEHPKYYTKIHVIYKFTGKDLPMDKLEKAVKKSEELYCGVEALFRRAIEVTSEIRVIEI